MAMPRRNLNGPAGDSFVHAHAYTLAGYSVAGTYAAAVGDIVTPDATGDWYVERAADNTAKHLGIVTKIELAATGTAVGYLVVEWFDAVRVVAIPTDDAATVTLLNSAKKDGDTTVGGVMDAATDTTGPLTIVSKGGLSTNGVGDVFALVFGS